MRVGRIALLGGSIACLTAGAVSAASAISISRAVYVERHSSATDGSTMRAIEPATELRKGDRVVLLVEWETDSPGFEQSARGYTVSSAVPRHLAFQSSSNESHQISADGGRKWGTLGKMRVFDLDGSRLASPEDVTNLRWNIPRSRLAKGNGRIAYSAIVR